MNGPFGVGRSAFGAPQTATRERAERTPRALRGLGMLAGCMSLAACLELSGPTDDIESLSTVLAPYPAVVAGDTLRDSLGVARRLDVVAFTGRGDTVAVPAGLQFFLPDTGTGVRIEDGFLIAGTRLGPVRVVAQVPGLQTPALAIEVVPAPTQVLPEPASLGNPATLAPKRYAFETSVTSAPLQVRVQGLSAGTPANVSGWIVDYVITRQPQSTVSGRQPAVLERGIRPDSLRAMDTTAAGVAGRAVIVNPALLANAADTVVVEAHVRYHGTHVPGSPVVFRVPFAFAP